jgi:hypothetical protein
VGEKDEREGDAVEGVIFAIPTFSAGLGSGNRYPNPALRSGPGLPEIK